MNPAARIYRTIRSHLRPLRQCARDAAGALHVQRVHTRWSRRRGATPHTLPGPLIVSLTSYPPRFPTLALSLKCLLLQSVRPDRVMLWIAAADASGLPDDVLRLERHGLQIETCDDLRSFKKLIPTLARFPSAFVATADDDVYYPSTWLAELIGGYEPQQRAIPAHRIHRITHKDGRVSPYAHWRHDIEAATASPNHFPTGIGGVLYPPSSLHTDVTNIDLLRRLTPTSDDAWFYWMARMNGWCFRKVGRRRPFISWPGAQRVALQYANTAGANDAQIANLIAYYGPPPGLTSQERRPARAHTRIRAW